MSRAPPRGGATGALRRLAALAWLKSDAESARLAETVRSRTRIAAAIAALGAADDPLANPGPLTAGAADKGRGDTPPGCDPALVRARLAHRVWIDAQRGHLNARLAMVVADWHRLQPAAARAFGRRRVLEELARDAESGQARKRAVARESAALRDALRVAGPGRNAQEETD